MSIQMSVYSERIYKNKINCNDELNNITEKCNQVKIEIYSKVTHGKLSIDDINTTYIIDNYNLNTYYANMVIRKVKETLKSNQELQKMYISDYEDKIESQTSKIEKKTNTLRHLLDLKEICIKYSKTKQIKNDLFIFPYKFYLRDNELYIQNTSTKKEFSFYEFECYINHRLSKTRSNLYNMKNKLNRLNQKLENIKIEPYKSCFGSRHLFKLQYTKEDYINNHERWLKDFRTKKYNNFVISGVKNYTQGSMCVRYNKQTQMLQIMTSNQGKKKTQINKHTGTITQSKYAKSEWFEIPCKFKYNEDLYFEALDNNKTIAYQIFDKGDYYIIVATFEWKNSKYLNTFTGDGIIGLDINVDRFALVNLDKHGNILNRKVIYFDLDGLTSNQSTKLIESKTNEMLKWCEQYHKPLVREDISNIKFKSTNNKNTNKKLTQFAYDKMISIIDRLFYKNNIMVFKVNPSYTSQQGKIKYMRKLGLSIHESAAMCIGRRYLFSKYDNNDKLIYLYYENMNQYNKYGTIKVISKHFSKIKTHNLYKLNNINVKIDEKIINKKTNTEELKYKKLNKYIKDVNNYFYNN